MIGRILGERYEIIEEIGNGGMAIVYRAKCRMLNRYVAIKVLKDEFKVDEEFVKKFNRESQAAASLSHPNIVSVYDVGNDNGIYYIVMELVEGITLKEYIAANPKMNWRMALKFSMQMCSALTHAHRNGIIHRDIKPHNIIISRDGNCKVTDFGIACVNNMSETRKLDEGILGSVHYISPEHAKGVIPDERSDIYSLGVTMYEMLTGQLPFDGDSAVSVAVMHINKEPEPIKDINIVVPLSLVKIVNKAMAKNINLRYQSADEMYRDLYEMSNDPDIFAIPKDEPEEEPDINLDKTKKMSEKEIQDIKDQIGIEDINIQEIKEGPKETEITIEVKSTEKKQKSKKGFLAGFFKDLFKADTKKDKVAVIAAVITSVIIIGAVFVIAADMLIPGTISSIFERNDREFVIPSMVGKTVDEVKEEYKDKKIEFVIDEEVFDEEKAAGIIISHKPLAEMNVKLPIKIHLTVSKGAKEVKLSRYIDKEYRQAQLEIKNLGLKCVETSEYSDEVPEGYVISQNPLPDTVVKSGTEVILTVSKGVDEEFAIVPDLIGKTEAEAKAKLSDYDLVLGGIIREASNEKEGTVIAQSVPKNSELAKKSKVMITVSNGKKPESEKKDETTTETNKSSDNNSNTQTNGGTGNSANNANTGNSSSSETPTETTKTYVLSLSLPTSEDTVKVTVKQAGKVVFDKEVKTSAKTLNVTLTGNGQQNIEVYYNGSLVKTQRITF